MTSSVRLGDILISRKHIAPHQLGVALSVQRRARLPLGQILLKANIINRAQLISALARQKLARLLSRQPKSIGLYGIELVAWGRAMLDRHLQASGTASAAASPELTSTLRLRSELAHLPPKRAGRIVEQDNVLEERLLSGNF